MGLLSKLFGSKNSGEDGPSAQEVEVHFVYGSTNFQHVYALGDQIQLAINEAKVGEYDGHAIPADGSEGRYFIYGPDAEAIYQGDRSRTGGVPYYARGYGHTCISAPRGWRTPKRVIQASPSERGFKPVGFRPSRKYHNPQAEARATCSCVTLPSCFSIAEATGEQAETIFHARLV